MTILSRNSLLTRGKRFEDKITYGIPHIQFFPIARPKACYFISPSGFDLSILHSLQTN